MNNSIKDNTTNFEINKTLILLICDIYTLLYCSIIIPISIYNLLYKTNIITWHIDIFSYLYFIVTGILNIYYAEYNFVIHHIICISLIMIGNSNNNLEYYSWLSKCYLAEISNIFISIKNILKYLRKKNILIKNQMEKIISWLFVIFYFSIRIFYIGMTTLIFIQNHYTQLNYGNIILINIIIMYLLNIYWGILIIKKVLLELTIKKN